MSFAPGQYLLGGGSPATGGALTAMGDEDDDDELERMAKKEMEEDDLLDFRSALLPKVPCSQAPIRPTTQPTSIGSTTWRPPPPQAFPRHTVPQEPPPLAALSGAPPPVPRGPAPPGRRSSAKSKNRYQDRDALLNCILNDETPRSRATTPRGSTPRGSTPRGSRQDGRSTPRSSSIHRSSLKTPVTSGGRRSQSHEVHFYDGGRRAPPTALKPRHLGSLDAFPGGKVAPHMLGILLPADGSSGTPRASKLASLEQPSSPRRSEASSTSSLPHLNEKRPQARKTVPVVAHHMPKSARNWRDTAVSLYT